MLLDNLPDAVCPALLLAEVVGEGGGSLADRQNVGRVDSLPVVARCWVLSGKHHHGRQMVLDNVIGVAAHVAQHLRPHEMVGADQERRPQSVTSTLNDAVEDVGLESTSPSDEALPEVAVDLWRHHESNVRIGEVAKAALEKLGCWHVVGVHLGHDVVLVAMGSMETVEVAMLRLGLELTRSSMPPLDTLAGEVMDTVLGAPLPNELVIPLVEQPHVNRTTVVPDGLHGQQRLRHKVERLLSGDDRRMDGDAQARDRHHGHRVIGHASKHPQGRCLRHTDELNERHQYDGSNTKKR